MLKRHMLFAIRNARLEDIPVLYQAFGYIAADSVEYPLGGIRIVFVPM